MEAFVLRIDFPVHQIRGLRNMDMGHAVHIAAPAAQIAVTTFAASTLGGFSHVVSPVLLR